MSSQQKEFVLRNEVMPAFARNGFTPFIPEWDSGIDFIAHRERDDRLLKVQLKSRWTINRKYLGRDIVICFPDGIANQRHWYLCKHDKMVEIAKENTQFLKTASWTTKKGYHCKVMSGRLLEKMEAYRLSFGDDSDSLFKLLGQG